MKSLALSIFFFGLILLFWAFVLIGITQGFPSFHLPNIPFLDLLKTGGTLAGVSIAYRALKTWKRTLKAQKRTEFLDQLMTAALEYVSSVQQVVAYVKYINISYEGAMEFDEGTEDEIYRRFLKTRAKGYHEGLNPLLEKTVPLLAKLRSMEYKGQIFGFDDYHTVQDACNKLGYITDRISALSTTLSMNWASTNRINPVLKELLSTDEEYYFIIIHDANNDLVRYIRHRYSEMHDS